jgi:flagellar protein FlaJ
MAIALVASFAALFVVGMILKIGFLFIFSFLALPISFGAFFMYPSYRASSRKANIDENLPFAVSAMATMAGSGANTLEMFRTIARGNRYGEMSREALKIVSDVENLGYTIKTALERAIDRTPSPKFRALAYKIISTMMAGGDLKALLMIQAEKVVDDTRREQEAAVEALGMVSEAYTVILILGPVLALVMSVIMMLLLPSMEPMMKMLQFALLMMVPIGYVVFTIMTSAIKPNL